MNKRYLSHNDQIEMACAELKRITSSGRGCYDIVAQIPVLLEKLDGSSPKQTFGFHQEFNALAWLRECEMLVDVYYLALNSHVDEVNLGMNKYLFEVK